MRFPGGMDDLSERIKREVDRALEQGALLLGRYLDQRAGPLFEVLRQAKPIVSARYLSVVTRHDDVVEVLDRHDIFTVALYTPKMEAITGPFILGLDDTSQYRHDYEALHRAIHRDDLDGVALVVGRVAEERLAAAASVGRIDVVGEFTDLVVERAIAEYFGTPGPHPATLIRWAKTLFHEIFINVNDAQDVHRRAMVAAAEMRPYIDRLIAERRRAIEAGDRRADVLSRLLRSQGEEPSLSDEAIRHNLIGLITGWVPTVSKAMALAVDELLDRPNELADAQEAARRGDRDLVAAYVFEALRFKPQNSGLLRKCAADHVVAAGSERATTIRAGATVFVATQSAMMDPEVLDRPKEFRLDRPWEHYLHFGHGLHRCFGEPINRVQIPEMAAALLSRPNLRRAPEPDGKLSWEGPYPGGLTVEFDSA